jgi:hypothetical protein
MMHMGFRNIMVEFQEILFRKMRRRYHLLGYNPEDGGDMFLRNVG